MNRLDMEPKIKGDLKFGIDQSLPGMVYAAVQLNPYKEADIISFAASKAEKMPGVLRILKIKGGIAVIATNSWYDIKADEAANCQWAQGNFRSDERSVGQEEVRKGKP